MLVAPLPSNEAQRLQSLYDLYVLDTQQEDEFNAIVRAAALVCGVPISLISLLDTDRQWFKANLGLLGVNEMPRDVAFCAHTILSNEIFEIVDARQDIRFADNPLVLGELGIRFYAGIPLRLSDGMNVGTLCVIDQKPRQLNEMQRNILCELALAVSCALERHRVMAMEQHRRQLQDDVIKEVSNEMTYRATHDALTGLVNRMEFEDRLQKTLNKAKEAKSEHALMYIDLDQFKLVNDSCGHSVGDQVLKQVSQLLSEIVRSRDTLARLGGDEFSLILEYCSVEQATRVAQQICDQMNEFRFFYNDQRFRIGVSIGLVPVDARWGNVAAILQAADSSCYVAKEAGRNRVHTWFDTDMVVRARHGEMQWTTRIEQALDENRFILFAQRIEPLRQEAEGIHAEVLLRMLDVDGALIPPGAFLPAAERFHLASRIDRWVLHHALEWLVGLTDARVIATLCINLSGQSIEDIAFHKFAIQSLAEVGAFFCQRICFEITETSAITNMEEAIQFIRQLHELGVRVALDDFGAGASSFSYLKALDVDFLKIDGQFIKNLIDDPLDDVAVRCFIDVAKLVGVKTVAEFVEKSETLERLREIGIDCVQGFLMHRPEPLSGLKLV